MEVLDTTLQLENHYNLMPHFYPQAQQEYHDPREERLQQLAALAQILQATQGGQVRQQEADSQNQLGLLGLLLQHQHQQGQLTQAAQGQIGEQSYHDAALAQQKAALDAENLRAAGLQSNEAAKLGLENTFHQQTLAQDAFRTFAQNPQVTPSQYPPIMKALGIQGGDALVQQAQETAANTHMQRILPQLQLLYPKFATDPVGAQKALNAMYQTDPGLQDPLVQDKLREPVRVLNEGLYHAPGTPGAAGPAYGPNGVQSLGDPNRLGGLLHIFDTAPGQDIRDAAQAKANQQFDVRDMFPFLFGKPIQQQ